VPRHRHQPPHGAQPVEPRCSVLAGAQEGEHEQADPDRHDRDQARDRPRRDLCRHQHEEDEAQHRHEVKYAVSEDGADERGPRSVAARTPPLTHPPHPTAAPQAPTPRPPPPPPSPPHPPTLPSAPPPPSPSPPNGPPLYLYRQTPAPPSARSARSASETGCGT